MVDKVLGADDGFRPPRSGWAIPPEFSHDMFMPDSVEELKAISIPEYDHATAVHRLAGVLQGVKELLNSIPTFLPIEGHVGRGPGVDGSGRTAILNKMFKRINLTVGEWLAVEQLLSDAGRQITRSLARAIDTIWRRWTRAEQEWRREIIEKTGLAEDVLYSTFRLAGGPERTILQEEVTWLEQSLPPLVEEVEPLLNAFQLPAVPRTNLAPHLPTEAPGPHPIGDDRTWLPVKQAIEFARLKGYEVTYTQVNRNKDQFENRPAIGKGRAKREVELVSFLRWLETRETRKREG